MHLTVVADLLPSAAAHEALRLTVVRAGPVGHAPGEHLAPVRGAGALHVGKIGAEWHQARTAPGWRRWHWRRHGDRRGWPPAVQPAPADHVVAAEELEAPAPAVDVPHGRVEAAVVRSAQLAGAASHGERHCLVGAAHVLRQVRVRELHGEVGVEAAAEGVGPPDDHRGAVAAVLVVVVHLAGVPAGRRRRPVGRGAVARPLDLEVAGPGALDVEAPHGDAAAAVAAAPEVSRRLAAGRRGAEAVEVAADNGAETAERVVPGDKHWQNVGLVEAVRRHAELDRSGARLEAREVDVVKQVLDVAGAAGAPLPAVLPRLQRPRAAGGAAQEDGVLHAEGEGPRGAQELQCPEAVWVVDVVGKRAANHVPQSPVSEVLGLLPVHGVPVVHAGVVDKLDVTQGVLADVGVVPVELVMHLVDHPVVAPVGRERVAALPAREEAVFVSLHVPGELVVQVEAKARVVVHDVAADLAERHEGRTNAPHGPPVAVTSKRTGAPEGDLVADDPVLDEVVGHTDPEDPAPLRGHAAVPVDRAVLPPGADDHVPAEGIVHLVAVLRVEAHGAVVPQDVLVHGGLVRAVDGDAYLLGADHGVALEDAAGAGTHDVEVQAVPAHERPLPAVLHARVTHVYVAGACHDGVQTLTSRLDVMSVARDEHRPLQVDHLSRHLEAPAIDLAEAAPVLSAQGLGDVNVAGHDCGHAVHGGLLAGRVRRGRGHPHAVPYAPAHGQGVVLEVQPRRAGRRGLAEQRPGPSEPAPVDVDGGAAEAAEEAVAEPVVAVGALHDVDGGLQVHGRLTCAHL
mmetsp:Transcript_63504/g.196576  ORF Transcript_63504/g.196576 Transcript_63504/m.196576 type:complete len:795 (-) Transcript_63504:538-2922(-)